MSGDVHKDLAKRAIPWIRSRSTGRGIRCGHEVPVGRSYVADTVVLCGLQNRFRKRYAPDYRLKRGMDGVLLLPEFACIFEAKASQADLASTFSRQDSNRYQPIGSLHWIVVPHLRVLGILDVGMWGILVASGGGLREHKQPRYCAATDTALYRIAYNLLWYGKEWPG